MSLSKEIVKSKPVRRGITITFEASEAVVAITALLVAQAQYENRRLGDREQWELAKLEKATEKMEREYQKLLDEERVEKEGS